MSTTENVIESEAVVNELMLVAVIKALQPLKTDSRARVLRAAAAFFGLEYMGHVE